jgi:hypothetical protein
MSIPAMTTMAVAIVIMASPALAGGGSRPQAHGASAQQVPAARGAPARHHPGVQSQVHDRLGGPRYEQRPDPNHQNPYRPMYSLDATPPGQPHPYFQTRKDGFGYPASRPVEVYLGNGIYVIPR